MIEKMPSKAQIEAAAKAIQDIEPSFPNEFEAAAKAALIAAAQVKPAVADLMQDPVAALDAAAQVGEHEAILREEAEFNDPEKFAEFFGSTAAAQVGEPNTVKELQKELTDETDLVYTMMEKLKTIEAATIEHCAQAAEKDGWHKAADAIRKLKDET